MLIKFNIMQIGNKNLPDICPKCGGKLLLTPCGRLLPEGGISFGVYNMRCFMTNCGYQTERVKLREDYDNRYTSQKQNLENVEDVTPYKKTSFLNRLLRIF